MKTYEIDASGKGGAFKTFKDCYAAVMKDKLAALCVSGGIGASQSNPWDWRLIHVAPGTYNETAGGTPPHTALVGTGSKPADVSIVMAQDSGDAIATTGRSIYVRNMRFTHTSKNADSHAMRDEGQAGDVGLGPLQRRTIVFEDTEFVSSPGAPWGKTAADILAGPGTTMVFNRCLFSSPGQAQIVNLVTNAKSVPGVSQYFLLSCTVEGNSAPANSGSANPTTSFPVGVPDFSENRGDSFVWMDGHWNIGSAAKVGGLLAFPLDVDAGTSMKQTHASTKYVVVNPGSDGSAPVIAPDPGLSVLTSVPEGLDLPLGCLSEEEATFFGKRPPRNPVTVGPAQPQSGQMNVSPDQTYWISIDLSGQSLASTTLEVSGAGSALKNAVLTLDHAGMPEPNGNAVVSGSADSGGKAQLATRWYFPGQGPVWVGLTFGSTASVVAIKAAKGQAFTSAVSNGVPSASELTPVDEGTLVPRVSLATQWPPKS